MVSGMFYLCNVLQLVIDRFNQGLFFRILSAILISEFFILFLTLATS